LACQNAKAPTKKAASPNYQPEDQQVSNFNFQVEPPAGWAMHDTIIEDLKYRVVLPPDSLDHDRPRISIVITSMHGREIDDYTTRNMDNLKATMEGVTLQERGAINISSISARWATYTREHNGVARDMIIYIIPVRGFAYVISGGANKGTITKYRILFDQLARSFKL